MGGEAAAGNIVATVNYARKMLMTPATDQRRRRSGLGGVGVALPGLQGEAQEPGGPRSGLYKEC